MYLSTRENDIASVWGEFYGDNYYDLATPQPEDEGRHLFSCLLHLTDNLVSRLSFLCLYSLVCKL